METLIIIGVLLIPVLYVIVIYNRLVSLRLRRENAFADIDVQLKQRHDLIPQLVSTVKNYAKHEKELFKEITEARSQAIQASSVDGKIAAEARLGQALSGLRVQVEAYPDLKANQNFMQLQEELADVENKLAAARRFFNSTTKEYNVGIQQFPANMIAGSFNFKSKPMFTLGEERSSHESRPELNF